jgi:hypothetical protein
VAAGRRIARTAVGDARPSPVETNLLEIAVLPIRVPDCPGIRFGEGRHLATAVIVEPLDAPFVMRSAISENVCWLCTLNLGAADDEIRIARPALRTRSRLAQASTVVAAPCCSASVAVSGSNRCRQVLYHTISRTLAV